MKDLFIGIDIGSSISKGCLIDIEGKLIKKYTKRHEYNEVEDLSEIWWRECIEIIDNMLSKEEYRKRIYSITVSSMGPNNIMIDENGKIVCKTRMYSDSFAFELERELDSISDDDTIYGNRTLSQLIKLKENEKGWNDVKQILTTHAYIGYRFTGECYCDTISAIEYGNVYDKELFCWNKEILDKYDIDVRLLPKIVNVAECVGKIDPQIAKILNLSDEVFIIAGSCDSFASLVGSGVKDENDQCIYYGTFAGAMIINSSLDKLLYNKVQRKYCRYTGPVPYNGRMIENFCRIFFEEVDFKKFDEAVQKSVPGANGVIFLQLPIIMLNDDIKGNIYNIGLDTSINDVCRAIYESFPYAVNVYWDMEWNLKMGFKRPQYVYISGGGTRSDVRNQINSDILQVNQIKLKDVESAIGTALIGIAAFDKGYFDRIQESRRKEARIWYYNEVDERYLRMNSCYERLIRENTDIK